MTIAIIGGGPTGPDSAILLSKQSREAPPTDIWNEHLGSIWEPT